MILLRYIQVGVNDLLQPDGHSLNIQPEAKKPEPGKSNTRKILINVSGQQFVSTFGTLSKYPDTKLGKCAIQQPNTTSYFFESDAEIFKEILKFYQVDELHCPKNVCESDFRAQLDFWEIDIDLISDCCSREMKEANELENQFQYFNKRIEAKSGKDDYCKSHSYLVWCFLTDPFGPDTKWRAGSKAWAVGYLVFTFFTGTVMAIGTTPSVWTIPESNSSEEQFNPYDEISNWNMSCDAYRDIWVKMLPRWWSYLNILCYCVYAIEIWTRFITCPNKRAFWKSINGLDMIISWIELLSIGFIFFATYYITPNAERFPDSSKICVASRVIQTSIVVVGQMRYLRLLTYASVYR